VNAARARSGGCTRDAALQGIDHIIVGCSDLHRAIRHFERLTGFEARLGGVHAGGATHNALLPLGQRRYLELLSPVDADRPSDDYWFVRAAACVEPRVLSYCLRAPMPLEALSDKAKSMGWQQSEVISNGRVTPDGRRLRWQYVVPSVEDFGLAFPFFIDWLDSEHPSASLQSADDDPDMQLVEFKVGHPRFARLSALLSAVGCAIETFPAKSTQFHVVIQTPGERISL
jgi:hypothetical protein